MKRVALYSYLLAKLAGISEDKALLLKHASPMHDIGKVATPDSILLKPGKLTWDEFEIMKQHAVIGYNILEIPNVIYFVLRQLLHMSTMKNGTAQAIQMV